MTTRITSSEGAPPTSSTEITTPIPTSANTEVHGIAPTSIPELLVQKISKKTIYQQIDNVLCRVRSSKGPATGFLIGQGLICVPFHLLELKEIGVVDERTKKYDVVPIECIYQGVSYIANYHSLSLQTAFDLDCAIFRIEDPDLFPVTDLELPVGEIEPGEKVYFGGFPLTQEIPTFHSGTVSSVSNKAGLSTFTIDATVVPGNSGGPVFVLQGNRLKLAGIITSQIADFSPEDERTIALMKALKEWMDNNPETNVGGMTISSVHGMRSTLTITTSRGQETVTISDRGLLCQICELVQRNLSTGIGKVLHVRHLLQVSEGRHVSVESPLAGTQPVMKDEPLPGELGKNIPYRHWYHRQVKGQQLCINIIGRQIPANGLITAKEEKILWQYYQTNPRYQGFQQTADLKLKKIKDKIDQASDKLMKKNRETWAEELSSLKTELPDSEALINTLLQKCSLN
jgi:hypothetical protein